MAKLYEKHRMANISEKLAQWRKPLMTLTMWQSMYQPAKAWLKITAARAAKLKVSGSES
jgi:hypothetical protein